MKILLTGSSGFVGSALKEYFIKNNIDVIDYDLPECDITDSVHFRQKIKDADMVVHMAAVADLYETAKDLDKNFHVNVYGTHIVGRVCADENIPLIFISTCCVYGNTGHLIETEDDTIPRTIEPYACSKVAGEYILRGMKNLKYAILRIGTVYGENMRESLFNYIAFDSVKNQKRINVYGDGTQTRKYIYIDDLVCGIKSAIDLFDKIKFETINLCSDEEISVIDTIEVSEYIIGKKANYEFSEDRYGEIQHEPISIGKARALLNWYPKYSYENAMKKTYENDFRFKLCAD